MSDYLLYLVITLWLAREVHNGIIIHKLVNKLMSKNYFDYQQCEKLGEQKPQETMNVPVVEDEELKALNSYFA